MCPLYDTAPGDAIVGNQSPRYYQFEHLLKLSFRENSYEMVPERRLTH